MERVELSTDNPCAPRKSRFPPRDCVRKGCGQTFLPATWNQTCCQAPECLREVRNWQAVKRQQKRRLRPEVRDAEAVRARTHRKRRRQQSAASVEPTVPNVPRKTPVSACASLRSTGNSGPICDRVGCYEPPRTTPQWGAAYCSDECCDEMRRVRDRERKYFWRRTEIGCIKCKATAMKRWKARQIVPVAGPSIGSSGQAGTRAVGVHPSRPASEASVLCGDRKEVICHDVKSTEETVASQSRPPPT